jgi:N-acetylmuramoyl-L-alanine amidase
MIICLDPGHGGRDPGAVGPSKTREADIVLKVAMRVGSLLSKKHEVFMTRCDDSTVSLRERTDIAKAAQAHVYVSIHCNGVINQNANGTETLHYPGSENGKKLARAIHDRFIASTGLRDRGIKERNLYVFRHTPKTMPAVMVELAFITNPEEERILLSEEFQKKAAEAIADGVLRYLGQ